MTIAERLARPAILALPAVDIAGAPVPGTIRLDANENPFPSLVQGEAEINRYPEPQPLMLRQRLAELYGVDVANLWVTRGSDDAIDLLIRAFCEAGVDKVAIVEPTFSAYAQFARIQGADVVSTRLDTDFAFDTDKVFEFATAQQPKILFLCTPNNPTGTMVSRDSIERLARVLPDTLVVVDEAYGEFGDSPSLSPIAGSIANLVVLRTLSKAYGLAGARIGCAVASPDVIGLLARVSPPYPLPVPSTRAALKALGPERMPAHAERIRLILA
ncbi:MAG: aminotransferase class I/II-fold pyridoxal phosphate-dependent enzyme, partial [Sphingomicrobium sp.]